MKLVDFHAGEWRPTQLQHGHAEGNNSDQEKHAMMCRQDRKMKESESLLVVSAEEDKTARWLQANTLFGGSVVADVE
ncbi:hypothetical protein FH972_006384 [Carpinus fangiana]|uniref:Uncharacterized protein n=1 Tax=Carpinus fangiana TaxID=176857 RepID=A0A5N6QSG0_9ROSI|nr:hypothetical protein FH972_006384 [Carpinus fangiana]